VAQARWSGEIWRRHKFGLTSNTGPGLKYCQKGHRMSWKTLCNDGIPTALALVFCLGAYGLYRGAWYVGYEANAFGLLGWHFLRFLLLLIAWITVVSTFRAVTGKERPRGRINVIEGASAISIFLGCVGCYPVWPLVLLLAALLLVVAPFSPNGLARGSVSGLA
jgi:hypothetical protein